METLVKGDVVIVSFPFSDLSQFKKRPALVLSVLKGFEVILCQITSKNTWSEYAIPLPQSDFSAGSIREDSNILPNKLFTADTSIIFYRAGTVNKKKIEEVTEKVCEMIQG